MFHAAYQIGAQENAEVAAFFAEILGPHGVLVELYSWT